MGPNQKAFTIAEWTSFFVLPSGKCFSIKVLLLIGWRALLVLFCQMQMSVKPFRDHRFYTD